MSTVGLQELHEKRHSEMFLEIFSIRNSENENSALPKKRNVSGNA